MSTEYDFSLKYKIKTNVPFDGTYYYKSQNQSAKNQLDYIQQSNIWTVSELWVNNILLAAFTPSVDVEFACTMKLSGGCYAEPYPGGGWQELRLIGVHKTASLHAPNM